MYLCVESCRYRTLARLLCMFYITMCLLFLIHLFKLNGLQNTFPVGCKCFDDVEVEQWCIPAVYFPTNTFHTPTYQCSTNHMFDISTNNRNCGTKNEQFPNSSIELCLITRWWKTWCNHIQSFHWHSFQWSYISAVWPTLLWFFWICGRMLVDIYVLFSLLKLYRCIFLRFCDVAEIIKVLWNNQILMASTCWKQTFHAVLL